MVADPEERGAVQGERTLLQLAIEPRLIIRVLAALAVGFVVCSLTLRLLFVNGYLRSFNFTINEVLNVDTERNPPTWVQASTMLGCGLLAWSISQHTGRRSWQLIAAFFLFISLDEAARLHENLISPVRALFGTEGTVLHYAWVIPTVPALALFAYLVRDALTVLPRADRVRLIRATGVFLLGSVGLEMLSGREVLNGVESARYVVLTHIEEGLEFAGLIGVLAVLMDVAGRRAVSMAV